jgi:hypothetical protein
MHFPVTVHPLHALRECSGRRPSPREKCFAGRNLAGALPWACPHFNTDRACFPWARGQTLRGRESTTSDALSCSASSDLNLQRKLQACICYLVWDLVQGAAYAHELPHQAPDLVLGCVKCPLGTSTRILCASIADVVHSTSALINPL